MLVIDKNRPMEVWDTVKISYPGMEEALEIEVKFLYLTRSEREKFFKKQEEEYKELFGAKNVKEMRKFDVELQNMMKKYIKKITLDWKGVQDSEGNEIPCSDKNKNDLFDYDFIFNSFITKNQEMVALGSKKT